MLKCYNIKKICQVFSFYLGKGLDTLFFVMVEFRNIQTIHILNK